MTTDGPQFENVQGWIAQGYTHTLSRHLLFRFGSPAGAQQFIRFLCPHVTSAKDWDDRKPPCLLNVGLSFSGLAAAGLRGEVLQVFPLDFQAGADPRRLGDDGTGAQWNGVPGPDLHCLVSLHATDAAVLDDLAGRTAAEAARSGTAALNVGPKGGPIAGQLLEEKRQLHFGYLDGISRPQVGWADPVSPPEIDFRHYLLGYGTDAIPSSPRLFPGSDPARAEAVEIARDGCYLVFRVMYQDVAGFHQFLEDNARRLGPVVGRNQAEAVEWLAAKMLGRWRTGEPLVLAPDRPNLALTLENDFDYSGDSLGRACPFSAHIRVVNPRDQPLDPVHIPVPRLLRRGMPYGPPLQGARDDGEERGLIGVFLCNSLSRHFEKTMDWINRNDFSPVFQDLRAQDPVLGNRSPDGASTNFRIPTPDGEERAVGLTTFVRSRGTAYFLAPGLSALRKLAGADRAVGAAEETPARA